MYKQSSLFAYAIIVLVLTQNEICSATDEKIDNVLLMQQSFQRRNYAHKMLSYMNSAAQPCTDFYEYACGNWKNVIEEHKSESKRNNILDIAYKLNNRIANILQRPHINDVAPEYAAEFDMAKMFYSNCLAGPSYPMRAAPEYLAVLKAIGGFPAVDANWNSDSFHWLNMSIQLSNYNIDHFVNELVPSNHYFPSTSGKPKFGFDIELHNENIGNKTSYGYKINAKRMHYILSLYGVEKQRRYIVVTGIFDLLENIINVLQAYRDDPQKFETLSKSLAASEVEAIKEKWRIIYDIAWLDEIYENVTPDFENCFWLLGKINEIFEANKRAAANYFSLKFIFNMDGQLRSKKDQNEFCIAKIRSSMEYFLDHLYMRLYFNNKQHKDVHNVIMELRHSLRNILLNANWLDESSRKVALLKESKLGEHIGRYEDSTISKTLIGEMKKLQFIRDNYEMNHLNLRKFEQHMKRFVAINYDKENAKRPFELLLGMQGNVFYYNNDNAIYAMAGALIEPIYNTAWPNSLKFGTLGYIIGHELSHAFDMIGANFDENGHKRSWWSSKTNDAFQAASKCYVDHYKKYLIPEINRNINGVLTKGENIADSAGLSIAFQAYRRSIELGTNALDPGSVVYGKEQMPGIDLSPDQMFFLGFTQLWCSAYNEADYWKELTTPNTIDKYRVLGALSNSEDFVRAYNCPVGSQMNPSVNKCKLW